MRLPWHRRRNVPALSHHSTIEAKDGEVHHQTDEESREAQVLPLAITPFDEVDQHAHLGPTWLDFFLDLCVVATLNVFSSAHVIDDGPSVATYTAYIAVLVWQWQSIVNHDIRYQRNDWVHRGLKFLQLGVFAAICAFGDRFNVTELHLHHFGTQTENLSVRTDNIRAVRAFHGVTVSVAAGRLLLALQYLGLMLWRKRRRPPLALFLPFGGALLSAVCWLSMHFYQANSNNADALRVILCFGSIVIEIIISLIVARLDKPSPARIRLLIERLALLSLIVLGEGVITIFAAFSSILAGIGFASSTYGLCFAAVVLLFELWYLNFASFAVHVHMPSGRAQIWAVLHLPLFICILLVLEGAANALLYANLGAALQYWGAQTGNFIDYIVLGSASNVTQSSLDEFSENLALIGINFAEVDAAFRQLNLTVNTLDSNTTSSDAIITSAVFNFFGITIFDTWLAYNVRVPAEATDLYTQFETARRTNNTASTTEDMFDRLAYILLECIMQSSLFFAPTAGGILLFSVILGVLQRTPGDRTGWLLLLPRTILAIALCFLGFLSIAHDGETISFDDTDNLFYLSPAYIWLDSLWLLPGIALAYLALIALEYLLLLRVTRRERQRNTTISPPDSLKASADEKATTPTAETTLPILETRRGSESGLSRRTTNRSEVSFLVPDE